MSLGLIVALLALEASPAAGEQPPIIFTGTRLSETERALRKCIARRCPPEEDIDAARLRVRGKPRIEFLDLTKDPGA